MNQSNNMEISTEILPYNFKYQDKNFVINNYDYFTTDYNMNQNLVHGLIDEYIFMLQILENVSHEKTIIDVGGNCGMFCIPASLLGFQVIAFEPIEMNVKLLELNKAENKCNNLTIINSALSNETSKKKIFIPYCSDNTSFNKEIALMNMKRKNYIEQDVDCITFDKWVSDKKLDIGFIKIDVQGYEFEVIEGMQEFLTRSNDLFLLLEWDEQISQKTNQTHQNIKQKIEDLGFIEVEIDWHKKDKLFYKG